MTAPGCAWRLGGISLPRIKPALWGKELSGPPSNLTPILLSVSPAGGSSHSQRPPHNQRLLHHHPPLPPPPPSPSCLFVLIPHPSISPHRCFPPRMFTISCFHFGARNLLYRSFGSLLFTPFYFVLSGFVSPSFSLLLFSLSFLPFFFLALLPFPLLPPLLLYLSIYSPADAVPFVLSPMTFLRGIA